MSAEDTMQDVARRLRCLLLSYVDGSEVTASLCCSLPSFRATLPLAHTIPRKRKPVDQLGSNGGPNAVAAVPDAELEAYAAGCGAELFHTSAKANVQVDALFKYIGQQMLKNHFKEAEQQLLHGSHRDSRISLGSNHTKQAQEGCC